MIQLDEVLAPLPAPPVRVNYTDLDLSGMSYSRLPAPPRPAPYHEPATDYAVIDFEATLAAARAGRDHVRRRKEELERRDCRSSVTHSGSVAAAPMQQQ